MSPASGARIRSRPWPAILAALFAAGASSAAAALGAGLASEASSATRIVHEPHPCLAPDEYPVIEASFDDSDIRTAKVYFRSDKYPGFYYVELEQKGGTFSSVLPKPSAETERILYYIEAVDITFQRAARTEHVLEIAPDCFDRRADEEPLVTEPEIVVGSLDASGPTLPPGFEAEGIVGTNASAGEPQPRSEVRSDGPPAIPVTPGERGSASLAPTSTSAEPPPARKGRRDVAFQLRALLGTYDNFFRAPDPSEARTVYPWGGDGRIILHRDGAFLETLYAEGDYTRYGSLGTSVGGGGGLHVQGGRHDFWLHARYFDDRPVFTVGDVVRAADILWAGGDYGYSLSSSWDVGLEFQTVRVHFDDSSQDAQSYQVGGNIRYLGFGSAMSPEAGGGLGWQRAENPTQRQRQPYYFYVRFISAPMSRVRTSVRYRYRTRSFTTALETSSNFGRSDDGEEWILTAALRASRHVAFELNYLRLDMNSTVQERVFATQRVTLGVRFRY